MIAFSALAIATTGSVIATTGFVIAFSTLVIATTGSEIATTGFVIAATGTVIAATGFVIEMTGAVIRTSALVRATTGAVMRAVGLPWWATVRGWIGAKRQVSFAAHLAHPTQDAVLGSPSRMGFVIPSETFQQFFSMVKIPSFRHSLPRSGIAGGLPESSAMEGNP